MDGIAVGAALVPPACEVIEPARLSSPLVFSSPHSGAFYPPEFLAASRLPAPLLRSSEDVAVDVLFADAPKHGAPLLRCLYPRAYIDVNRDAGELDGKLFDPAPPIANPRSLRVASGLGVIPRVVAEGQAIYSGKIPLSQGVARIDSIYRPYHAQLEALFDRAVQRFGVALLVDCHSMPSRMPTGDARKPYEPVQADIVLGYRHGGSCDAGFFHRIHAILSSFGYRVARNRPYAGGYITEHYAAPARGRHTLQIEINRALYLDENTQQPHQGFERLQRNMARLIAEIAPARELPGGAFRAAAE